MLPAILIVICAFMVKNAATQTIAASLGTAKSCVVEGRDDVKLLCTVSAGCCGSTRAWKKVVGSVSLLNNGVSTDPSKYVEEYDNGTTGFNLIIKNVQKSDFGISYQCQYGVNPSNELYLNYTLCPPSEVNMCVKCWICAAIDYGWSILGSVIATLIMIFVKWIIKIIAKVKELTFRYDRKSLLRDGSLFLISAILNALIATFIGYFACHCVDGTGPWFILLGLVISVITSGISLIYRLYYGVDLDFWKECCLQVFGAVCAGVIGAVITRCAGKKSRQDGDQNEKDEKSQPLAK